MLGIEYWQNVLGFAYLRGHIRQTFTGKVPTPKQAFALIRSGVTVTYEDDGSATLGLVTWPRKIGKDACE